LRGKYEFLATYQWRKGEKDMAVVRRVPFKHVNNFRDIGGYATKDGMAVKWRRLYRCDSLANLRTDEWPMFESLNIRTVIDLRSKAEIKKNPDNLPKTIRYYHCPLQEEEINSRQKDNDSQSAKKAFELSMGAGYLSILHNNSKLLTAAVMTVCDNLKRGNVVFHCTAGKDRTGVLTAVILTLLGVRRNDIIADYEISHTLNQKFNKIVLKQMPDIKKKIYMLDSNPEDMKVFLDELKKVKIEKYLIENGGMKDRIDYLLRELREEIE